MCREACRAMPAFATVVARSLEVIVQSSNCAKYQVWKGKLRNSANKGAVRFVELTASFNLILLCPKILAARCLRVLLWWLPLWR